MAGKIQVEIPFSLDSSGRLLKGCRTCKRMLDLEKDFHKNSCFLGRQLDCKECKKEINKLRYETKKKEIRYKDLLTIYGITQVEYEALLVKQNGVCAICFNSEIIPGRKLAVDHDHTTGKIRGLLCKGCNTGIGYFKENENNMLSAIRYLRSHKIKMEN